MTTDVLEKQQEQIEITDELTPAERANLIRGAKGAMVNVNVSSIR